MVLLIMALVCLGLASFVKIMEVVLQMFPKIAAQMYKKKIEI